MISAIEQFPRFEKGSPSFEYQQIVNFCSHYLAGMLVALMHQDVAADNFDDPEQLSQLQRKMLARERTVRHAFLFQIEKYFADFKSIRRTRLRLNPVSGNHIPGFSNHKLSQIQPLIQTLSLPHQQKLQGQLNSTSIRLKKLVHRSDGNTDDNPVSPLNLFNAFQAGIDNLGLSIAKNRLLLELLDVTLQNQLLNFYQQIDLGLYHLGIMPELTDPALFRVAPAVENIEDTIAQDALVPAKPEAKVATQALQHDLRRPGAKGNKKHRAKTDLQILIERFKFETEHGTLNHERLLTAMTRDITPLLDQKRRCDVARFLDYFIRLLNNTLISTPLKTQLSRISCPLLQLVLIDPFFFRSSTHPVNDFLLSIIDFELRYKHQGSSLLFLSRLIDELLSVENPALCDYQPLISRYEHFKQQESQRLNNLKAEQEAQQTQLKQKLLNLINDITENLVVERATLAFFYDDWQLCLLQLANQSGMDSSEFKKAVELAEIVCWMLDETKSDLHPDHPATAFKTVLKDIDKQLNTLNFSDEHRARIRKQLVREYKAANRRQDITFIPSAAATDNYSAQNSSQDMTQPVATQSNAIVQARALQRGDWVEVWLSARQYSRRAKLQRISADLQHYTFIDPHGHCILDCDIRQLADALLQGKITRL